MEETLRLPQQTLQVDLVAVDLDGTFLNEHSEVSALSAKVVARLAEKGIAFCLATGRLPARLPESVRALPDLYWGVFCNGGSVRALPSGKALLCHPLEKETLLQVRAFLDQHSYYYEVYSEGQPYTDERLNAFYSDSFYTPAKLKSMSQARWVLTEAELQYKLEQDPVEKIFLPWIPEEEKENLMGFLKQFSGLAVSSSGGHTVELNDCRCSKVTGLKALAEHLGLDPQKCLVFGDAGNDAEMLQSFPLSVAMGNAKPEIQEMAAFVTRSNREEGVAYFLQKFVLDEWV